MIIPLLRKKINPYFQKTGIDFQTIYDLFTFVRAEC